MSLTLAGRTGGLSSSGSGLSVAQAEKLAVIVHGTQKFPVPPEMGTYDADATTGSNRDVAARLLSNTADSEGRFIFQPLPLRTGVASVICRLHNTIGASGSAGLEVAYKWTGAVYDVGVALAAALPNAQTVYQDMSAQTAHVPTVFDITIDGSLFDPTKLFAMKLERLASSDARDDYTSGSYYLHWIELIYTGWGGAAAPSAPV